MIIPNNGESGHANKVANLKKLTSLTAGTEKLIIARMNPLR